PTRLLASDVVCQRLVHRLALEPQPGLLQHHRRVRRDALGEPDVRADHRPLADHRLTAEDGGVGVPPYAVAEGWVPLVPALEQLTVVVLGEAQSPERHALVELPPAADLARLADHHAGAVVDEKPRADGGPRMDVDARLRVSELRHHPGD